VPINNFRQCAWLLILMVLLANNAGCGSKEPARHVVFPVTGKLLVDGRPAEQAIVYFHPRNGDATRPFATVTADGSFQPGTYTTTDGVAAGEYVLTVEWPKITVVEGEEQRGPDQLAGRYGNPQHPVATVTVKEGENAIPPLDLKKR
jgi:hypothetical protein